jgi:hypothetical protein
LRVARYLLVAVLLAGCGDDSAPDVAEVEQDLARVVQERTGTQGARVECPEDVGEGDSCDVIAPGGVRASIKVTRLGDEADGDLLLP